MYLLRRITKILFLFLNRYVRCTERTAANTKCTSTGIINIITGEYTESPVRGTHTCRKNGVNKIRTEFLTVLKDCVKKGIKKNLDCYKDVKKK